MNPHHVLGETTAGHGMYGDQTVNVKAVDLAAAPGILAQRLDGIVTDALSRGRAHNPL